MLFIFTLIVSFGVVGIQIIRSSRQLERHFDDLERRLINLENRLIDWCTHIQLHNSTAGK